MTVGALNLDDTAAEHTERIRALRASMRRLGLAAVAVASPENVYYLTGLDHLGYFAFTLLVVPREGAPTLVTRAMERPTVRAQVPWCRHVVFGEDEPAAPAAASVLAEVVEAGATVALDEDSMFFPPSTAARLVALLPGLRWTNGSGLLAGQRAVKSGGEIDHVRRAARLSDRAMAAGLAALRPGVPQRRVAAGVYRTMIADGGQPPGFAPLIRPTSMLDQEHVSWSDGPVRPGQGWFFELSASVRRYHAPLSRTVYVGHAPDGADQAAAAALAGLVAARDALRPGVRTGEVYAAWERAVAGHPSPAWPLRHHCGYLVGIGFPPSWVGGGQVLGIRPGGEVAVAAGMTFHLMSWVTRPVGHVVSDTALVTPAGAELLTTVPRGLTVVG
ncbi:M24 family metallopeptidase [Pseudonocardia acaciae]|uniref:M24 family metallopeptidase n=1 Tax=Pseudonocardia acaciae TaxID=551276 RepID=UPI000686A017|nr:Xaa-Pro peptidase family protein [Pseudonocardia acaciae]